MSPREPGAAATPRAGRPWGLALLLVLAAALFAGLGLWQVQRLHWKHALIARVEARVHAAPVALPTAAALTRPDDFAYTRVFASGTYDPATTALVRATTDLGTGYWAMTLLRRADGPPVWINRGFVPAGTALGAVRSATPAGPVTVTGLLRADEPDGSLLQANRPADERWYSRDLAALAAARHAGPVLPAFVDAFAETGAPGRGLTPVAGLTQVHFSDNHLGYALTWFALCLGSVAGLALVWRRANSAA